MLKTRVLTAVVLAPLFLAAIWFWPTPWIAGLLAVVVSLGGAEWARLIGVAGLPGRAAYLAALWGLMLAGWAYYQSGATLLPLFVLVGLWWLGALYWLQRYSDQPGIPAPPVWLGALIGYVVLGPAWLSLVYLHGDGNWGRFFFILLLFLVWAADVGAYFTGRAFGRRKLAPRVSPNKSWEGAFGGAILALVVAAVLHWLLGPGWPPLYVLLPLTLVTVMFSVVGDLFESMVKRQRGAKDSGTLLPGHGGVLDRVDSLTAAGPIFVLGLLWWRVIA